jgi:hypothetical protein
MTSIGVVQTLPLGRTCPLKYRLYSGILDLAFFTRVEPIPFKFNQFRK